MTGTAYLTASILPAGVRSFPYHNLLPLTTIQGLDILEGSELQKTYIDTDVQSGTHLKRVFCTECGTFMFAYTPLREDIVSVAAGTLDDFESWKPDTEQWRCFRAGFVEDIKAVSDERRFERSVTAKSTE